MITMYAIPNCDTVRKARKWLSKHNIAYEFHDYKKAGAPEAKLRSWAESEGWETLCNRRGMTWRKLSDEQKAAVNDTQSATALMMDKTSVIKRPIIEGASELVIGFDEEIYQRVFL